MTYLALLSCLAIQIAEECGFVSIMYSSVTWPEKVKCLFMIFTLCNTFIFIMSYLFRRFV